MTNQIHIDAARVRELFAAALADRGEGYVYQRPAQGDACLYWHNPSSETQPPGVAGQPGCLVGYVLHAAGVPGTTLAANEGQDSSTVCDRLRAAGVVTVTYRAKSLLSDAQERQDDGAPWGEAVARALANDAEWLSDD